MDDRARAARAFLEGIAARDPVACNGCTACCRGSTVVELRDEWGDEPETYRHVQVEMLDGRRARTLGRRENGDCAYLGIGGCMIYETRPMICRAFDCRRNLIAYTPEDRRRAIAMKACSPAIFAAGAERMPTLRIQPEEADLYDGQIGASVLAKKGL